MFPIHSSPPGAVQNSTALASPAATENSKPADAANEAKLKKAGGDLTAEAFEPGADEEN